MLYTPNQPPLALTERVSEGLEVDVDSVDMGEHCVEHLVADIAVRDVDALDVVLVGGGGEFEN